MYPPAHRERHQRHKDEANEINEKQLMIHEFQGFELPMMKNPEEGQDHESDDVLEKVLIQARDNAQNRLSQTACVGWGILMLTTGRVMAKPKMPSVIPSVLSLLNLSRLSMIGMFP